MASREQQELSKKLMEEIKSTVDPLQKVADFWTILLKKEDNYDK